MKLLAGEVTHAGAGKILDLWDPAARRLVRRTIDQWQPDVVHLHNVVRELSPSVLGASRSAPVVMTVHELRAFGSPEHRGSGPRALADRLVLGPLTRYGARRLAAVIAVSDTVADVLRAAGLSRVVSVPVPVPAPLVRPRSPAECADVVFAASLTPGKGAQVLLEAFTALAGKHPQARLVLLGDGPEFDALRAAAAPLGSRVLLAGRVDPLGVSAAMARARVVVVPSLRPEGSSLTAAEGARHGRPVVTSDVPASAEVARQVGGDVVPAGDVAALTARLDHWLADDADAVAAGGRAAHLAAAHYDVNAVTAQIRQVYADVLRIRNTADGARAGR